MPANQSQNPYLPYIQNLLKAADLDLLPEEEKEGYINDLTREIEKRVGLLIMQELKEKDFNKYTKLVTSGKEEDLLQAPQFLDKKIKDWPDKLGQALKSFADEFVQTAKQVKLK